MLLTINVGNSHLSLAVYEDGQRKFVASLATQLHQTAHFYALLLRQTLSLYGVEAVDAAVVSSVVPQMNGVLQQALSLLGVSECLSLASGVKTGLNIRAEYPRQIGADRIAAAVAAAALAPLPCVIVGLSTATTFTVLDEKGALIGSAITAGMQLSVDALHERAAQLPAASLLCTEPPLLAKSTEQAIQAGALIGTAAMIEGMAARYNAALQAAPTLLLTGGGAKLVSPLVQLPHKVEPYLILDGLALIWQKNQAR